MSSTLIDYTPEQESQSVPLSKESLQAINAASIESSRSNNDNMEMADPLLTSTSSSSSSDIDPEEHSETASTTATEVSLSSLDHQTAEPSTSSTASFSFANDGQARPEDVEEEPRRPLSRPLSRQDLRRKSSFFNNKEIVVNPQRYSATTYSSLRPIADPRFKNRFQSILSQWKARDSN
ncbi:hypothetical protein BGZ93_004617 [Podila epicladia]|nr:hypothetical protein BGZ92_010643 [Podila epicladia]KAG0100026.1 hypothetical protein BGZ93_004617 [Podila epicladia]